LIKVTAIFNSAFFVVSEEREAGHLVGEGADERKCLHVVNIPGEIEVEVILEIALRDGAGFDFCEVQAEQSETLQRMAQRARGVRQREAQADLFRVFGQNGFTRNDDEARAVVIGILNIGGDLLLVGGFGLNVAGAAIATVFAQAMSVALSLLLIRGKHLAFILRRQDIRFDGAIIGRILKLGSPAALQDLLVNITFLVIIAIANSMGTIPSAGVGVAEKLCAFVMLVPSAYMQSMSAFVAQNIGAGLETRARRALLYGVLSSLMAGLLMGWAAFFHGDVLAGIFADDPAVIAAAWEYLKAYAIDCLLTSFLFCFVGFFNGCGQTLFVMAQGMVGARGLRLPVALLVSRAADSSLFHLGLATPASTVVQIFLCGIWYLRRSHRLNRLGLIRK